MGFVVISRYAGELDPTNGAVTRLEAWRKALPEIRVLPGTALPDRSMAGDRVCCDLTGGKAGDILRHWTTWRRHHPVAYMQDSVARYFVSQFLFRFGRGRVDCALSLVNAVRGFCREILARLLYRKVGYICRRDASFVLPAGEAIEVILPLLSSLDCAALRTGKPRKVGVIGNFEFAPNMDGLIALLGCSELVERVYRLGLKIVLLGLGSKEAIRRCPAEALAVIDVEASGPYDCHASALDSVDIVVSPAMYGSGAKNKILEASNRGKVCFAWSGFGSEFGYDERLTVYFSSVCNLAAKLATYCRLAEASPGAPCELLTAQLKITTFFQSDDEQEQTT